jgi:16S rRNA (guanine527-N7)-methyltransferase
VDLGSGGGYPGLPLALWHPQVPWALLDARRRKAEFLAAAGALAGRFGAGKVTGHHLRGGDAPRETTLHRRCQLVVSRAMGQAVAVLAEAGPLLRHHGHCLMFKGQGFHGAEEDTVREACVKMGYRFVGQRSIILEEGDPERLLVVFERSA